MAELVCAIGTPHTPLIWSAMRDPIPGDLAGVAAAYEYQRNLLDETSVDSVVLVASDHFRQLVPSNMPAFMVGKAAQMRGTHPNEEREFGLPRRVVPGDVELARTILGHHELVAGFDFSYSDEPWLDHSFMVPLLYLRPELDLPVVPVYTNCNAPPLPRADRFAALGRHVRSSIERHPSNGRVALIATGHLSFELGGPRQFSGGSVDPGFDEDALGWMRTGDLEAAILGCSYERLSVAGNLTFQFLNFLTLLGATDGAPASRVEAPVCRFGPEPFFSWRVS